MDFKKRDEDRKADKRLSKEKQRILAETMVRAPERKIGRRDAVNKMNRTYGKDLTKTWDDPLPYYKGSAEE